MGLGYAYILTHPGTPCLFWEHFFEWGDDLRNEITTLLQVSVLEGTIATAWRMQWIWVNADWRMAEVAVVTSVIAWHIRWHD